jgi:DNA/RNA-binding domain of Phe-tRNA-synthetase-like protein
MGPFVHVILFSLKPAATRDLVARIQSTFEAIAIAKTPPLLESAILVSDDEDRVAIVSQWNDRNDWAHAQWDERVQASVVDVFQTAEHVETHSYNEVYRFDATRRPR